MGNREPDAPDVDPTPERSIPEGPSSPATVKSWWRRPWVPIVLVAVAVVAGVGVVAVVNEAPQRAEHPVHELIMVDFREGVDPFNLGESPGARYEHVAGTYRVTVKNTDFPLNTSLGEFVRTAYAVGIRAEVVEMTAPGISVGAMCLGPTTEGGDELVGYGFFVEPGGAYILERQDADGSLESLEQGTDARVDTVTRVSIICAPHEDDVSLIGFANGLEVVVAEDLDGHDVYTYAGLTVKDATAGTQVRFTRVSARVPDEEWTA